MLRTILRLAALAALALVDLRLALAQERIALVIGNARYGAGSMPRLTNPVNDARLMERTFRDLGFRVTVLTNASEDEMEQAILTFGKKLGAAGKDAVGLFYFSGHGVQSEGINYMIPIDAAIETQQDVEAEAPRMGLVIRQMRAARNAINFIVLDACRNNSLPSDTRAAARGLARATDNGADGLLIAYATTPGTTASDGGGSNSPYTQALAETLATDGLIAEQAFKRVADRVFSSTNGRQSPWFESGLRGDDFCFAKCGTGSARPIATVEPQPDAGVRAADADAPTPVRPAAPVTTEAGTGSMIAALGLAVYASPLAQQQEYARTFGTEGIPGGLVVSGVEAGSDAAVRGLRAGDVILRVQSGWVDTPRDLEREVEVARAIKDQEIRLEVLRGAKVQTVTVRISSM